MNFLTLIIESGSANLPVVILCTVSRLCYYIRGNLTPNEKILLVFVCLRIAKGVVLCTKKESDLVF